MSNNDHDPTLRERWDALPPWAKLTAIGVAVAGAVLLIKAMRRGAAGAVIAAVAPIAAMGAARASAVHADIEPVSTTSSVDRSALDRALREIAEQQPLIPPALLRQTLAERSVMFHSDQHMARALGDIGLRSEVRTVTGRVERRWYNLSEYVSHA